MIFDIREEFGYEFGMSTYIPVTRPVPVIFEIKENPNPVKAGKTHQIVVGSCEYPHVWVLLPCLPPNSRTKPKNSDIPMLFSS